MERRCDCLQRYASTRYAQPEFKNAIRFNIGGDTLKANTSAPIEPSIVESQLKLILESKQFAKSARLRRFLRYLVDQALAGNDRALKGYSIGLDVFDRPDDFDPTVDTIVRVHAGKLRSRLDLYYATEGANDALRILVPKGSYVPVFQVTLNPEAPSATSIEEVATGADAARYSIADHGFELPYHAAEAAGQEEE